MNPVESLIYGMVKRNPRVKNLIRDTYQAIFSLVPVPKERTAYPVRVREGYFFGFHDKNPWSEGNRYLLAHGYHNLANVPPQKQHQLIIGFFEGDNNLYFRKIAETRCFNWQQGSMLQWIGKEDIFLFNDLGKQEPVARIFGTDGKEHGQLEVPAAAVSPDGRYALSYNFARLQQLFDGYGYVHGTDAEARSERPSKHGISLVDITSGQQKMIFSVKDIAAIQPDKSMEGASHFITHGLFSPSGNRFTFLHRWIKDNNFLFTRMFSSDLNGNDLHLFPTGDMVSHIAWQDDDHVLAYSRSPENQDGYILFKDRSDEFHFVGSNHFNSDGHPSFPRNHSEWIVTDTYPDRFRQSRLIAYNLLTDTRYDLGVFRQPLGYREAVRCDLHPRWNHGGTSICFDSAHTGKRSLCTMETGNAIETGKFSAI